MKKRVKKIYISSVPPLTVNVLYHLGLAVEAGCDESVMRKAFGDETVNWLKTCEKSPEWQKFIQEDDLLWERR